MDSLTKEPSSPGAIDKQLYFNFGVFIPRPVRAKDGKRIYRHFHNITLNIISQSICFTYNS